MNTRLDLHPKDCLPPHGPHWHDESRAEAGRRLDSGATYWILAAIGTGIAVFILWVSIE